MWLTEKNGWCIVEVKHISKLAPQMFQSLAELSQLIKISQLLCVIWITQNYTAWCKMRFGWLQRDKGEEACTSYSFYSRSITLLLVAEKLIN